MGLKWRGRQNRSTCRRGNYLVADVDVEKYTMIIKTRHIVRRRFLLLYVFFSTNTRYHEVKMLKSLCVCVCDHSYVAI